MTSAICAICSWPVEAGAPGSAELVQGWIPHRRAGGANTVSVTTRFNRWAHWTCITSERIVGQLDLLEELDMAIEDRSGPTGQ